MTRTPRRVLGWLLDGDPLRLWTRCQDRLEESGLLVSPRRAWLRALARIAHAACREGSDPGMCTGAWVDARLDEALAELVAEQAEEERRGTRPAESGDPEYYAEIGRRLGVDPAQARRACVALNGRPIGARRARGELERMLERVRSSGLSDPGRPSSATARR